MPTLEQRRASDALIKIGQVAEGQHTEYSTLARGLPAMLQANGLAQTLAFLMAKAENNSPNRSVHARLLSHLTDWLDRNVRVQIQPNPSTILPSRELFRWVVNAETGIYRRTFVEAMAYATWLRRFAEAKAWT